MLQFSRNGCIQHAKTNLVTLGSEHRTVHDEGWQDMQRTGARHTIAFSLLPIEVEFAGEETVVLAPPITAMTRPDGGYTRAPMSSRGQRTVFFSVDTKTAQESVAVYDASAFDREIPFPARSAPCSPNAIAMAIQLERIAFDPQCTMDTIQFEDLAMQIISQSLGAYYSSRGSSQPRQQSSQITTRRDRINHAMVLMCNAPARNWSLSEIAEKVSLSPAYLSRIFKRYTGNTLSQSLRLIRISSALEQLADRRGDFSALALDCGFASHAHMSTTFVSQLGVTPSDLAQRPSRSAQSYLATLSRQLFHWRDQPN